MIRVIEEGTYKLLETKKLIKILELKNNNFAWVYVGNIGEILVTTHKKHFDEHVLARGRYVIYDVAKEKKFKDLLHLELYVGTGHWQGYLLPNGLPNGVLRRRIIPTKEIINKN